jgi:hypothetical protein
MAVKQSGMVGPRGGLRASARALRGWAWNGRGKLVSRPVRCKKDDWYIARAQAADAGALNRADLLCGFLRDDEVIAQQRLRLRSHGVTERPGELLGWFQTPEDATHLQLCLPDAALAAGIEEITFQDVSERDPKCHPLANVPRWSDLRPPFPLERVVLPRSLAPLREDLDDVEVDLVARSPSLATLRRRARHAACIVDPAWVRDGGWSLADVRRIAQQAWVIVDLDTMVRLVRDAGLADAKVVTHRSEHGIMSARVQYADVPTRGLALQDVVPYCAVQADGAFCVRAIQAGRTWRKHADDAGLATLLSTETPWEQKHGDILSAIQPVDGGGLLVTDLPWLVAGRQGSLLTPELTRNLLRAHLGRPIPDHVQYWNRWDTAETVIRDIGEMPRRYRPLRAVRWESTQPGRAHLGIMFWPADGPPRRHLMFRTGRADSTDVHDGVPPEAMQIFMKWLAREWREATPWAARNLRETSVTWQFDTDAGLKYAAHYDAATQLDGQRLEVVRLRMGDAAEDAAAPHAELVFPEDEGLHGNQALEFQDALTRHLGDVIKHAGRR